MLREVWTKIPDWGSSIPQLMSLWNMITFQLQPLCSQLCLLQNYRDWLQQFINKHPDGKDAPIINDIEINFKGAFNGIKKCLEDVGLISSPKLINQILNRFNEMSYIRLHEATINIQQMMINEIKDIFLIYVPRERFIWMENQENINKAIIESFPSTIYDLEESTFCYASGRYTASVFHSMRILEYGLSALAKDVGLSFDVQQWYDIINQIEKEIKKSRNVPKSSEKTERLQFLSAAAKEFTYFKDGWRNYVSHNRSIYDEYQSLSLINHVRDFMVHLSTKLKE